MNKIDCIVCSEEFAAEDWQVCALVYLPICPDCQEQIDEDAALADDDDDEQDYERR